MPSSSWPWPWRVHQALPPDLGRAYRSIEESFSSWTWRKRWRVGRRVLGRGGGVKENSVIASGRALAHLGATDGGPRRKSDQGNDVP
jgi:hypothetical protein